MKRILSVGFVMCSIVLLSAQNGQTKWKATSEPQKVFIENKSQFDGLNNLKDRQVLFATDEGTVTVFFTKTGLTYRLIKHKPRIQKEETQKRDVEHYAETGEEEQAGEPETDFVHLTWENSNRDVKIEASEEASFYYNYTVTNQAVSKVKAYRKLIYKSLYPNIDVVYSFHQQKGIKYDIVLHPGADASLIKMKYSNLKEIAVDEKQNILLPTKFGFITDHAPHTFYADNHSEVITSRFQKNGKTVSFSLGNYDHSKTVVIDPWTVAPNMPSTNTVFYIKSDSSGNAYLFGGDNPIRLQKYDATGSLVWTYNTPWTSASTWFGALATDRFGNCYITDGSGATLRKIDTAGAFVWSNSSAQPPLNSIEYWALDFNCDQTQVYVAGSRHIPFSFDFNATIFRINMNNGSVASFTNVAHKAFTGLPTGISEVRSMCSSPDGNLYFLTMDTVGAFTTANSAMPFRRLSTYSFPYYMLYSSPGGSGQGQNNIRANSFFIYTTDGETLHKRDIATGNILATATIPQGSANNNSGVAIDSCGNVYVGAQNKVVKYDADLNFISSAATPEPVYDVSVGKNGDVFACGHNYAVALAMNACGQIKAGCYSTPLGANASKTDAFCNICNGTATANPVSGTAPYAYLWSNGGTTQTITGLCPGSYTVTITDGSSNTAAASVNVAQTGGAGTVSITADKTIMCAGDSALICATPGHGSYLWNTGETGQCIRAKLAGNYYVTVTDGGTCTAASNRITVSVYPVPPVSVTVNGDTMTAYNASSYQWYLNDVAINGATSPVYVATQPGNYTVQVTDTNGCKATSTKITIVTGIGDLTQTSGIHIFPNPLEKGRWNLQVNKDMLESSIEIFDAEGRLVYKADVRQLQQEIELNAESGVYMMRLASGQRITTIRLVKL